MRILYWTDELMPNSGGVAVRATRLLPELRDRGHEIVVVGSHLSADRPDYEEYEGIPVHRFSFWDTINRADLQGLLRIRSGVARIKKELRPDLVHMDFLGPSALFHLQTAAAHPAPLLVTMQQADCLGGKRDDSLLVHTLREADHVAFCSEYARREVEELIPEVAGRASVIHNGVIVPEIAPAPLPFDPPVLLCLGRLVHEKGFDLVIEAMARLAERLPEVGLLVAGDGLERAALEARVGELGLDDRVDFLGWVDREGIPDLLNRATLVLIPSRREAFGLVAAEAGTMGRPVVAAEVGGLPEVVSQGETGILVSPEDPEAIAEGVARLLADPDTTRRMGAAARARVLGTFGWEAHVEAYDRIYRTLSEERSDAGI